MAIWFLLGMRSAAVQTPSGRLLRRSSEQSDRPALFAAQFALSHACWLLTYPLAGWLGAAIGLTPTFLLLAGLVAIGCLIAAIVWPGDDRDILEHVREDLPPDHPHLQKTGAERTAGGVRHAHVFVIDPLHRKWPS
jgi:predicted MFS family arabinose efflux permease